MVFQLWKCGTCGTLRIYGSCPVEDPEDKILGCRRCGRPTRHRFFSHKAATAAPVAENKGGRFNVV